MSNPPQSNVSANVSAKASAKAHNKPRLALRVGVTGARILDLDRLEGLRKQTHKVLADVRAAMNALADDPAVVTHYATADGRLEPPLLRLLSPIALGADRLVAHEALKLGYGLYVPMPFPQGQYELDFKGTVPVKAPNVPPITQAEDLNDFHQLLDKARGAWMALDGKRGEDPTNDLRNRAYEAVGHFVVRNSDIIIAIWNGEPAAGRGGTEQIVRYAASVGVPIWWIHATADVEPVWIADIQDLRDPSPPVAAEKRLSAYLRQQILPQEPITRDHHAVLERIAQLGLSPRADPAAEYFEEQPLPRRFYWGLYSRMMRFASGSMPSGTPAVKPPNEAGAYWFQLYQPADARAGEYAARYRSAYVWIFLLTTLSLFFGAMANMFHGHDDMPTHLGFTIPAHGVVGIFAFLEFCALLLIAVFASLAIRTDWHQHSIEYRLLAELCRKQQVLAPLGRSISFGALQRLQAQAHALNEDATVGLVSDAQKGEPPTSRAAWVSWLYMAYQRAAPLIRGDIAALLPGVVGQDVLQDLVEEQLDYHAGRAYIAAAAAKTFEQIGAGIFFLVMLTVATKVWFSWFASETLAHRADGLTAFLGLLGVVFPAVSAAAVGIGSYAEWRLLAEQSNHMLELLGLAKKRIQRIDLHRPLASQDLGTEADAVASLMLQDLEGWQRLFRVKVIDTQ